MYKKRATRVNAAANYTVPSHSLSKPATTHKNNFYTFYSAEQIECGGGHSYLPSSIVYCLPDHLLRKRGTTSASSQDGKTTQPPAFRSSSSCTRLLTLPFPSTSKAFDFASRYGRPPMLEHDRMALAEAVDAASVDTKRTPLGTGAVLDDVSGLVGSNDAI